jgi:Ca2+-binding RTX toxin-like protein
MMHFHSWLEAIRNRNRRRKQTRPRPADVCQQPTESLERRTLLSVSSLIINGELSIISDADDSIAIRVNPFDLTTLQVLENGTSATTVGNVQVADITSININAGAGNNLIDLSGVDSNTFINLTSVSVRGNDGNDTIIGTLDLNDSLTGGDGDDTITGGLGNNVIDAGDGNDEVTSGAGDDTVDLGDGNDLLFAGLGNDSVRGSDGDDTISGEDGNDTIDSGNGADIINGNDGDDSLTTGFGDDLVNGDDGDDTISAGAGNDTVGGGLGDDRLLGNSQQDLINGGEGNDTINGGSGRDTIDAGEGDDSVNGAAGRDTITLGPGNDRGIGGGADDLIDGNEGDDTLIGNSGSDTLRGGDGNDSIFGGQGSDRLEADDTTSAAPTAAAAARLFATPIDGSNQIVELDPLTGDEVFRFNAPENPSMTRDGLAFDGTSLFFLSGDGTDLLYEIDPNTQQVLDADPIIAGSREYDGLAFLGGLIYILDTRAIDIHVFDPVTDQIINTLDIDGINPTIAPLIGGLAGIAAPDRLVVTEAGGRRVLEINPLTGAVEVAFSVGTPSAGQYLGAAVVNGEIYLGSGNLQSFDVFSRQGLFVRNVSLPYSVSAFGGDDLNAATVMPGNLPQSRFDIDLRFTGSFSQSQQDLFRVAADRWEEVILADIPDVFVPGIGQVDDIVIEFRTSAIDGSGGVLAQTALVAARLGTFLPSAAFIEFDTADLVSLDNSGQLRDVVLHEIAHSLGFGSIWEDLGLVSGAGGVDPRFLGVNATREYNLQFGLNETTVPVENIGGQGSADVHWRETVFGNDLMTSVIDPGTNLITRMTIAQFQDLGYQVDLSAADSGSSVRSSSLSSLFQARQQGPLGLLGEFAPLGSGVFTNSSAGRRGANPIDLALQAAADRGDPLPVFGRTRLLDVTPMLVIPGLAPEKAALISAEELEQLTAFLSGNKAPLTATSSSGPLALVAPEIEPNNAPNTPLNVDAFFSKEFDPNIGDLVVNTSTFIPHVTINGTGDDTFDFYSFTVTNSGDRGIFDIDFGNEIGDDFDSEIFLFDDQGNPIFDTIKSIPAENDDSSITAGAAGSTSGLDSFLEFTFQTPGLYIVGVGQFDTDAVQGGLTGETVPRGSDYLLQISIENHSLSTIVTQIPDQIFGDTLDGGTGNGNGRGDEFFGSPGNDLIRGTNEDDTILAGDGDDSIFAGAGDDNVNGGAGDDTIVGNAGADTLTGGLGNNVLRYGLNDGNDSILASAGLDTLNIDGTNNNDVYVISGEDTDLLVRLDLPSGNDATIRIASGTTVVNINGRAGNDRFDIQPIQNVSQVSVNLNGGDGRDRFDSSAVDLSNIRISFNGDDGNDTIMGGIAAEIFNGGAGNDLITGGDGGDRIDGGAGDDTISGQSGNDTLLGSSGNDSLFGGLGDDSIDGGLNNDTIDGAEGADSLNGGTGNDRVFGRGGDDTLQGSAGNDTLEGNNGADFLNGGSDNDLLKGGGGEDTLRGGDGDDELRGGGRRDVINGGDGQDLVLGGDDNDTITGGDGDDTVNGQAGDDTVVGGDGHDVLTGGGSGDLLLGGDGDDTLTGNSGIDTLAGGAGVDQIARPDGQDVIDETFSLSAQLITILQALPPVA